MGRRSALAAVLLALSAGSALGEVRLGGRITDNNNGPVGGAKVTIAAAEGAYKVVAVSDPTGAFSAILPAPGPCELRVDREGFFLLTKTLELAEGSNEAILVLNKVEEVIESVDVSTTPGVVDMDRTAPQSQLSGTKLLDVPYPTTNNLRNSLRIMPGVVQDSRGGIHLHGGAEEQTLYTLDGFQINDPLTGRFETRLSVESVQSLEATAGRPTAEFGKASAGTLMIRTRTGGDKWRYSATNFLPGLEFQKGLTIGGWTPRASVSGPYKTGRAWFSNSFDTQFINNIVPELPKGKDREASWRFSNLLHNQVNLSPSNILFSGFLVNYYNAPRTGLSALDPPETTLDRRQREWFGYLKNQRYFRRGALLEYGYAGTRTFSREIPQGQGAYIVTPYGRRGNNFLDATHKGGRDEWLANVFLPSFTWLGGHQLKAGIDADRITYWQDVRRAMVEYSSLQLQPVRTLAYFGPGLLSRSNVEAASYVQDSWRVRPQVLLEIGFRTDWDRILGNWNLSPRVGFAWSPPGLERTKISGGFARIYDSASLRVFTRHLDQFAASTYYLPDGEVSRGPALSIFQIDNSRLPNPRYNNWNIGVEQQWWKRIQTRATYIKRRGRRGFTYVNELDYGPPPDLGSYQGFPHPQFDAVYNLSSSRRDSYDAVEFTARQPIGQQYEWMVSFTRSRARSNAVVDFSVDEPLLIPDNAGRQPWDTPNRLVSWGYLPTFWENWAIAYLLEWRSGFPYSIQNEYGSIVGPVNDQRFPRYFELNLHAERRLTFRGNRWAVRFGFNNITGHANPNVVNNVIGAPEYGQYLGGQRRSANIRLRWLGKVR